MAPDNRLSGELRQLYWRSRRGMLELDLLLVPFTLEAYAGLSLADQARYRQLLEREDQELFAWLLRRESAAGWRSLINRILAHNAARAQKGKR